jgi:RNA polymerase sigma factor FliA
MRANSAYATVESSPVSPSSSVTAKRRTGAAAGRNIEEEERNERIEQHLPLVRRVVDRIRRTLPRHIDAEDLYSAGVTGLIAASHRYDPSQHRTFPGYACLRIRGAVLDELRRLDWCPRRTRARTRRIHAAIQQAEQSLGRTPTDAEMCSRLNMPKAEFAKWRQASTPVRFLPLDQPADSDDRASNTLHEIIADDKHVCVRDSMEKQELLELVAERIAALPDVQKRILAMYYHEGMRLAEIAAVFGRTESRISQIHARAVTTLRAEIMALQDRRSR